MIERLSSLEELILLAVKALSDDAYGVSVQDMLTKAGQSTTLGAVYASLERLEQKGHVTASLGEATAVRGGRRKRLFRPTRGGLGALSAARSVRTRLLISARGGAS